MAREIIRTRDAPSSPFYAQAVKAGGMIHVSGLVGIDVTTGKLAGPTIAEQTRQAITNCANILRAGGAGLEDVVEVQVLLARPEDFSGLNTEYAKFFPEDPPARSVAKLGVEIQDVLVSIRMTACLAG